MSNTNEKVYVNSIWFEEKVFDDGGSILKASITVDELIAFLKANKNKEGKVNLVISKKKNIEPKKSTHYAYLDTWQPAQRTNAAGAKAPSAKPISKTVKPTQQEEESLI